MQMIPSYTLAVAPITDIESMLSEDLQHIIEWLNNNFVYLNYSKTKIMLTGTHQRLALVDSFTVRAGDTLLSRMESIGLSILALC